MITDTDVARICHQTNKAYCESLDDFSQKDWDEAPEWQKESARLGVIFHINNPNASASASHNSWLEQKRKDGWKYGKVKDEIKKEHPCFVSFEELPEEQQIKDKLFKNIVESCRSITFVEKKEE